MSRPIIVGEAPARDFDPLALPFSSPGTERNLERLLGKDWRHRYNVMNMLQTEQPSSGKGSSFDMDSAKMAFSWMVNAGIFNDVKVLLCGQRVAEAFGLKGIDYFEVVQVPSAKAGMMIPHPTGINQWWNDGQTVAFYGSHVRSFAEEKACNAGAE
jgi:uracil-DNA glycosylase